ncbi:MAG: hypothetical protein IZT59_03940 [Verrucomicrobia bacterium]|nr:hypothetical protein [Verrucomicrobiota bacterium]
MKNPFILFLALGLASCASPKKALIIAEGPKGQPKQAATLSESIVPAPADDGLRMPDMLALPDEEQLRSTAPESSRDATVIIRPPAE